MAQLHLYVKNEEMALKRVRKDETMEIQQAVTDVVILELWKLVGLVMDQLLLFARNEEMESRKEQRDEMMATPLI